MKIEGSNNDRVVLEELGSRLARTRLERNLTQAQLAQEAGVAKTTVERLEGGGEVKTKSLVRVLRALGLLGALDRLVPEPLPSPVDRVRMQGRRRRRARQPNAAPSESEGPWRWGDGDPGGDG